MEPHPVTWRDLEDDIRSRPPGWNAKLHSSFDVQAAWSGLCEHQSSPLWWNKDFLSSLSLPLSSLSLFLSLLSLPLSLSLSLSLSPPLSPSTLSFSLSLLFLPPSLPLPLFLILFSLSSQLEHASSQSLIFPLQAWWHDPLSRLIP